MDNKSLGQNVTEYSVVISSLIIFFGFLKQYWFYNAFNISIQKFLSIEEVLIMFLGELPFIVKLLLFGITYYIIIFLVVKIYLTYKDHKGFNNGDSEKIYRREIDSFFGNKKNLFILLILSFILSIIGIFIFRKTYSEFAIVYLTLMSCQTIYVFLDIVELEISQFLSNMIVFIFSLSVVLYCKNIIDIKKILNNPVQSELIYNDVDNNKKIDTTNILIGKTNNYLFLFNPKENVTKVIKSENFICLRSNYSNGE
ncbi:hypothetical protein [Flavobacterium channae]|uniref:hypothetical protein n=1 Tax=Flavobacterium channae TaxID=2897181 RepID=UPI001E2E00CE|nr:hypothetical protein [Flavobacterium channae]UGS23131.1 hypothetical protein LOS89_10215 [Flavobacterium channae]